MKEHVLLKRRRFTFCSVSVIVAVGLSLCSCKKAQNIDVSSGAEQASKVVRVAITNWAATNGINVEMSNQMLASAETFGNNARMAITNEIAVETFAAGTALKQLLDRGTLPGVAKGEHGYLSFDPVLSVLSNNAVPMSYPATRTFHLVKDGETSTNNYTVVKQARSNSWDLQRAWQTDSNGQFIQEWPVH